MKRLRKQSEGSTTINTFVSYGDGLCQAHRQKFIGTVSSPPLRNCNECLTNERIALSADVIYSDARTKPTREESRCSICNFWRRRQAHVFPVAVRNRCDTSVAIEGACDCTHVFARTQLVVFCPSPQLPALRQANGIVRTSTVRPKRNFGGQHRNIEFQSVSAAKLHSAASGCL